ncbi:alkyl hydroperoxide reductase [Calderihabitans maritimus]|uniref:Alkyl hydroperoxide reductase n=2 Tax=Calderihabitans maritimus TaxID=1246530 RepID=A0A1Z5HNZ7_9FIRM|nr:alkyl hydroperoxide reductase [Calderihabitans maritimus]
MPALQAFYEKYGNDKVVLLTVNIMQRETVKGIQEFMQGNGYTLPVALDRQGLASRLYGVSGIPATYFIDAAGRIRSKHLGPLNINILEKNVTKLFSGSG